MTKEEFQAAAKAIADYRWILAAALSSTNISHAKQSKARMKELSDLRDALENEGMK